VARRSDRGEDVVRRSADKVDSVEIGEIADGLSPVACGGIARRGDLVGVAAEPQRATGEHHRIDIAAQRKCFDEPVTLTPVPGSGPNPPGSD
jgi:hypothetical protein